MNKVILISILIGIAIVFSLVSLYSEYPDDSSSVPKIDFIYSDLDKIQKTLVANNISMTTPVPITDHTVDQYCTFFDGENVQNFVQYCLTTALVNSDGETLGNLNMGGNPVTPIMALAIIETSPFIDSKKDDTAIIFENMIDILVCDCWKDQQPGGFESVSEWLDAAQNEYEKSDQTTLKSKINGLAQKQLVLEITATEKSYFWTLIVM